MIDKAILVFDTAYTFKMIEERSLHEFVTSKRLGGYFSRVVSVHPFASLFDDPDDEASYGGPSFHQIGDSLVVEGKVGRFRALRWIAPLNFLFAQIALVRRLIRLSSEIRPAIIRAEDPLYNGLLALFLARRLRRPLMIGVWGNPTLTRMLSKRPLMPRIFRSIRMEEAVERFVLRRASIVLVQNENNRQFALSAGVRPERVALFRLGNALHPSHFEDPARRSDGWPDLERFGIARGTKLLMCIARLIPEKMLDIPIKALARLKEMGEQPKLLLVGEGYFEDSLRALGRELGVSEQIIFTGNRDQEWLARVLPLISVVVSPGTGRALVEAGLASAPIVACNIEWQAEVIRSGETGELVPVNDGVVMANAVARLLHDPHYARQLGLRLRCELSEMMDPKSLDEAQAAVCDRLLSQSN